MTAALSETDILNDREAANTRFITALFVTLVANERTTALVSLATVAAWATDVLRVLTLPNTRFVATLEVALAESPRDNTSARWRTVVASTDVATALG